MNQWMYLLAADAEAAPGPMSMIPSLILMVGMLVVFYFMLIRPQRKRDKADEEMRNNLAVGDVVTTRGGIVGKVTNIKDDEITISTGSDGVKIRVMRWAVARKEEKISIA